MADVGQINAFLQKRLRSEGRSEVRAVEAANWLDVAGLLKDSKTRRGKPLRDLLRARLISGAYQESGRWWWIRQTQRPVARLREPSAPARHDPEHPSTLGDSTEAIVSAANARAAGFTGFLTVGECMKSGFPTGRPPSLSGVYILCAPTGFEPDFIPPDEALAAGNVHFPWTAERLARKWVESAEVLYIGKSTEFRRRLRQLVRHAQGRTVTHTGGEIVWQLRGFQHLLICWRPCHEPREFESSLLQAFRRSQEGKLPFANRQD